MQVELNCPKIHVLCQELPEERERDFHLKLLAEVISFLPDSKISLLSTFYTLFNSRWSNSLQHKQAK
jgi:hypothetical protein